MGAHMTGDDLKCFRITAKLSRRVLARLAEVHPDTVRYWERKARVDLRGWAPDRLLRALGKGDLVQRNTYPARPTLGGFLHTTRARGGVLQQCGAKTRKGRPCRAKVLPKKNRCKHHGGLSTGPKTPEGRARIAEAQRLRWEKSRQSK